MKFVAVTACPTGIAHSQMAAENLEQHAPKKGHEIKVEVNGAMGTENELSADDIASADAVIVAADTKVQTDRFEGKPLVKGTVKDAVNDPEALIDEAASVAGDATAEAAPETETDVTSTETELAADQSSTDEDDGGLFGKVKKRFT
ncbi:PTS fructose transporter subunit IIB [Haladaptatus sp. GCM10025707]|uniref:PTS fructose transporter subunit IIB n=1 Tax=unclassified Haladaptatus TaxID=2622732 RepID=UPI0023E8015C|nr:MULTISPECIES: PTS fructose transporter subunit IIB [unclassified Haladaptatus]